MTPSSFSIKKWSLGGRFDITGSSIETSEDVTVHSRAEISQMFHMKWKLNVSIYVSLSRRIAVCVNFV